MNAPTRTLSLPADAISLSSIEVQTNNVLNGLDFDAVVGHPANDGRLFLGDVLAIVLNAEAIAINKMGAKSIRGQKTTATIASKQIGALLSAAKSEFAGRGCEFQADICGSMCGAQFSDGSYPKIKMRLLTNASN